MMLTRSFVQVYTKFKLHFYKSVMSGFQNREASLSTVETFCMETILALDGPTINEFAGFVGISPPNAAYKVNRLVQKGYVQKVQSASDRREYYLKPTPRYMEYYNLSNGYMDTVMQRIRARFAPAELKRLEEMLTIISTELMTEVPLGE